MNETASPSPSSSWGTFLLLTLLLLALCYSLLWRWLLRPFLKGELPLPVARRFSRLIHYPKLPFVLAAFSLGLKKSPYWSQVAPGLVMGALPCTRWHVEALSKRWKVQAVVNLCDEDSGPLSYYQLYEMEQLHLPTVDHNEPSLQDLETAVAFIHRQHQLGRTVLVHCMAGRGRSAAVVLCWMLASQRMNPVEAQQALSKKRAMVRPRLCQQKNVLAFYQRLCQSEVHLLQQLQQEQLA
ncbi:putative Chromatin modification-related protein EAF3 [Balamuthia mandrillaris]